MATFATAVPRRRGGAQNYQAADIKPTP